MSEEIPLEIIDYISKSPKIIKHCIIQNFTTKQFCREYDICENLSWDEQDKKLLESRESGPTNKELKNFFQTIRYIYNI